jgi:hypothetical protein
MPQLDFEVQAPDFSEVSQRALSRVRKLAGTDAMTWFKRSRLKKRFDGSMKEELRFQRRDPRWNNYKARFGASGKPMRYTGSSERIAMRAPIKVTKQRMQIRITGLHRGFSPRQRRATHPPMWKELARISRYEQQRIAAIYAKRYAYYLQIEIDKAQRRRRKV